MGTTAPQRGTMTRGPLPASVYWRRRVAVFGTAFLLVIAVVNKFDDDADPKTQAKTTSAEVRTPVVAANVGAPSKKKSKKTQVAAPTPTVIPTAPPSLEPAPAPVLPSPTGRCSDDDVQVSATVDKAEAANPVWFTLTVKTGIESACLWQVNAKSVQVQVTSGSDRIWSTLDCPKAVPTKLLTLRRDTPVTFGVKWTARRSDDECSDHTQWAKPGYYHVQAAALGGEPVDVQFQLTKPAPKPKPTPTTAPTVAPTAAPATTPQSPKKKRKGRRSEPTGIPTVYD